MASERVLFSNTDGEQPEFRKKLLVALMEVLATYTNKGYAQIKTTAAMEAHVAAAAEHDRRTPSAEITTLQALRQCWRETQDGELTDKARKWLKKAALLQMRELGLSDEPRGHPGAAVALNAVELLNSGNGNEALTAFAQLSTYTHHTRHWRVMFILSQCYEHGIGTGANAAEAVYYGDLSNDCEPAIPAMEFIALVAGVAIPSETLFV
jgi:TPR repeat protein